MNKKRYLVEVSQQLITPVTVYASSKHEAKELAMNEHGEPADCYFAGHKIISVTLKPTSVQKDD